jgi:hypothetical protein
MPCTGQLAMLMLPLSLASIAFPARSWRLKPSAASFVKRFASTSRTAIALFSCRVTHAVFESPETAMYSGSRSMLSATPAEGFMRWIRGSSVDFAKESNETVVTSACVRPATPPVMSIIATDPAGSPPAPSSPSFATSSRRPFGVNVNMSGPAPTVT